MKRTRAYCGMRIAECGLIRNKFRNPKSEIRNASGFTYIALLAAIVIIGISLSAAGRYWSHVLLREKEEELLFRGEQYRLAIERYYFAKAPNTLPATVEQLLKDDRFPAAKRHLRHPFKDPITGEDFELIRDKAKGNRIVGVQSTSGGTPLKQGGFPDPYGKFAEKQSYTDWKFQFEPPLTPQQQQLLLQQQRQQQAPP